MAARLDVSKCSFFVLVAAAVFLCAFIATLDMAGYWPYIGIGEALWQSLF